MDVEQQNINERRDRFERSALPLLDDVYSTALTMTRSPVGAQHLVQETYARTYVAYEQTGPNGGSGDSAELRTWLYRTLTDTFVHWYRRQPDSDILHALDALPDELRIAIHLADVERFSYSEIADIMSTSTDTVRAQLLRGRRRIREELTEPALST